MKARSRKRTNKDELSEEAEWPNVGILEKTGGKQNNIFFDDVQFVTCSLRNFYCGWHFPFHGDSDFRFLSWLNKKCRLAWWGACVCTCVCVCACSRADKCLHVYVSSLP